MKHGGTILLLGANDRATYSVARNLKMHGYRSAVVSWEDHPVKYSRFIEKFYQLSDITQNVNAFFGEFLRLLKNENFSCIIPINDIAVEFCSFFRLEIECRCPVLGLNPPDIQKFAQNKYALIELCRKLNIATPETYLITTLEDFYSVKNNISFPLIAKPVQSKKIIGNGVYNFTVKKFSDLRPLEDFVREKVLKVPLMLQSVVEGFGVGFNFCSQDGHLIAYYMHERLREPQGGGESSFRKTLLNDKYLIGEKSTQLIRQIRWTGVGMLEFKIQNGQPYVMELNGRFWGSVEVGILSGVEIPFLHVYHNLEKNPVPAKPIKPTREVYVRNIRNDFLNVIKTRSPLTILYWILSLSGHFRGNVIVEDSIFKDFKFRLFMWLELVRKAACTLHFQLSYWWVKFFLRKPRINVANPRRILFVCEGNICRSPFAAEYLKKIRPDLEAVSAGLQSEAMKLSPGYAVEAARTFGVDLNTHTSQFILDKDILKFDVIFIMDVSNYVKIKTLLPHYRKKLFFLNPEKEIRDPFGKDLDYFKDCYREIARVIDATFKK